MFNLRRVVLTINQNPLTRASNLAGDLIAEAVNGKIDAINAAIEELTRRVFAGKA